MQLVTNTTLANLDACAFERKGYQELLEDLMVDGLVDSGQNLTLADNAGLDVEWYIEQVEWSGSTVIDGERHYYLRGERIPVG